MREIRFEFERISHMGLTVSQVTEVEPETMRVCLYQGAFAASPPAQAERLQHFLPGISLSHRLSQFCIGPGPVTSEM